MNGVQPHAALISHALMLHMPINVSARVEVAISDTYLVGGTEAVKHTGITDGGS